MNAAALNGSHVKLTPIIFSHALMMSNAHYSRHCIELASHGYIVFALNHNDGSCNYTENLDGDPVYFDKQFKRYDYYKRRS